MQEESKFVINNLDDCMVKIPSPEPMTITFFLKDKEVMKICEDGSFYYLGEKVEGAKEVYQMMKKFLEEGFRSEI